MSFRKAIYIRATGEMTIVRVYTFESIRNVFKTDWFYYTDSKIVSFNSRDVSVYVNGCYEDNLTINLNASYYLKRELFGDVIIVCPSDDLSLNCIANFRINDSSQQDVYYKY